MTTGPEPYPRAYGESCHRRIKSGLTSSTRLDEIRNFRPEIRLYAIATDIQHASRRQSKWAVPTGTGALCVSAPSQRLLVLRIPLKRPECVSSGH